MNLWRGLLGVAMIAVLALVGFLASSCSTLVKQRAVLSPPDIEGATFVGNTVCGECHTNYTRMFHDSPHARLNISGVKVPGGIS